MATKQQVRAAFQAIAALADAIRELERVPSGHLYARVMGHIDLDTYESFIDKLVGAKLVERKGHELVWVGPKEVTFSS
jgi:hypothetical protein